MAPVTGAIAVLLMTNDPENDDDLLPDFDPPSDEDGTIEAYLPGRVSDGNPSKDISVITISTSGDLMFHAFDKETIAEILSEMRDPARDDSARMESAWLLLASEIGRIGKIVSGGLMTTVGMAAPKVVPSVLPSDRLDRLETLVKQLSHQNKALSSQAIELSKIVHEQKDYQTEIFNEFMNRLDAVEARLLEHESFAEEESRERGKFFRKRFLR